MYEYPCRMIRVINGNTVEADIDLGFGISIKQNIRLFGIDNTDESMTALIKALPRDFICQTIYNKRGKIGRVLGVLFREDENGGRVNINEALIAQGLAKK
jgi:endonuclease YncB( thermonuclease family)